MKQSSTILAVAVLGLFGSAAMAADDGLFSSLTLTEKAARADTALAAIQSNPSVRSFTLVDAKAANVNTTNQRLRLNLGPNLDLNAYQLESYQTKDGMTVWSGMLETSAKLRGYQFFDEQEVLDDPMNQVTLVRNGAKITGNVRLNGELYEIRPLSQGGHAIIAKDLSRMPAEHPPSFQHAVSIPMRVNGEQSKAVSTIRVMVNYTPAAAAAVGDITGLINLAVAETNQSYANSGIQISMVLANASQITYTETGNFDTDLARYRISNDGFMDSIHATRDGSAADVGVLIVTNSAYCGLASGIGSTASTAFAEVYWDCATGYYSFGHEVGHLQSARHDPKNDPTNTPYSYGHGYQYIGKGRNATKWRTVMAYDCTGGCPRLKYWSNPNVTYGGVPMGTASSSDNARVLNNTAATIAGFR